jgi:hypothetical protein
MDASLLTALTFFSEACTWAAQALAAGGGGSCGAADPGGAGKVGQGGKAACGGATDAPGEALACAVDAVDAVDADGAGDGVATDPAPGAGDEQEEQATKFSVEASNAAPRAIR